MKVKQTVKVIRSLLIMQCLTTLLASFSLYFAYGRPEAISAGLGGLAALLPTVIFAKKAFRYQGARAARQIVKSFYLGEALKILVSMVLFTMIFMFYKVKAPAFFVTYIAVIMNYWFTPLFFANKHNRPESD